MSEATSEEAHKPETSMSKRSSSERRAKSVDRLSRSIDRMRPPSSSPDMQPPPPPPLPPPGDPIIVGGNSGTNGKNTSNGNSKGGFSSPAAERGRQRMARSMTRGASGSTARSSSASGVGGGRRAESPSSSMSERGRAGAPPSSRRPLEHSSSAGSGSSPATGAGATGGSSPRPLPSRPRSVGPGTRPTKDADREKDRKETGKEPSATRPSPLKKGPKDTPSSPLKGKSRDSARFSTGNASNKKGSGVGGSAPLGNSSHEKARVELDELVGEGNAAVLAASRQELWSRLKSLPPSENHDQSMDGAAEVTVGVRVQPPATTTARGARVGNGGIAGLGSTLDGESSTNEDTAAVAVLGQQITLSRKAPTGDDDNAPHVTEQLLFAYDHVFSGDGSSSNGGASSSGGSDENGDGPQQEVFESVGYNALSSAWSGGDSTIFAYGQVCVRTLTSLLIYPWFSPFGRPEPFVSTVLNHSSLKNTRDSLFFADGQW